MPVAFHPDTVSIDLHKFPLVLIIGLISLYFLITGIKAMIQRRMIVSNPLADASPVSVEGVLFNALKRKVQQDLNLSDHAMDKRPQIEITGSEAQLRAGLHIALGLIALLILGVSMYPDLFFDVVDRVLINLRGLQ